MSLITLMAFMIGILSTGAPIYTNAETSPNSPISSEKSNYGITINEDGTVAIVELNNDESTTETQDRIGSVVSDVSDKKEVEVGTLVTLSTTTTGQQLYTL